MYQFPITAIHQDGSTVLLYSADEVMRFISTVKTRRGGVLVGREWDESEYHIGYRSIYTGYSRESYTERWRNLYILRDDFGRPVTWQDFKPERPNWKDRKGDFTYREGPVPGYGRNYGPRHRCNKIHPGRKANGGRGAHVRAEAHRREFHYEMTGCRIRRHYYAD